MLVAELYCVTTGSYVWYRPQIDALLDDEENVVGEGQWLEIVALDADPLPERWRRFHVNLYSR